MHPETDAARPAVCPAVYPAAVRAVAQALRHNPLPIVLPCHRIIGSGGALVGYSGHRIGLKQRLLDLEGIRTAHRRRDVCVDRRAMYAWDRSDRAVEVFLEYWRGQGTDWSPHPTEEEVLREYDQIWSLLGNRQIEELLDLPLITNPDVLDVLDVFTEIVTPAMFIDAKLLALVICRMVSLSLEHGNSDGSCYAYVWLGMLAGPHFGNYQAGFRFGKLGYDLVEERGLHRYQARTYMDFGTLIIPWTRHIKTGRELQRRCFDAANRIGDVTYAAYSRNVLYTNFLAAGDPLAEVQREAETGLEFATNIRFGLVIDYITAQLGLIRTLRGLTATFGAFNDERFDERRFERHLASDPGLALPKCPRLAITTNWSARRITGPLKAATSFVPRRSKSSRRRQRSPRRWST